MVSPLPRSRFRRQTAWRVLATLACCAVGVWSSRLEACDCAGPTLACEAAWRADAVFVGRVVAVDAAVSDGGATRHLRRVDMTVIEPFRDFQLSQVSVFTGYGSTDCGVPFEMGESYLVYAHRSREGRFTTSACTRTNSVSRATEDLAYLRSLKSLDTSMPARMPGRVTFYDPASRPAWRSAPRVTVHATGGGRTFSANTRRDGEFELKGLPLGKYDLTVTAPRGYAAAARAIEIFDPRGCGTVTVFLVHDARVTGRVVDSRGTAVRGLPVEIVRRSLVDKVPRSDDRPGAWTGADGTFELRRVTPGDYLLAFNHLPTLYERDALPRAFYPGVIDPAGARTISVSARDRVRLRDFVVPPAIPLALVQGLVVDSSDRPVSNAIVTLEDDYKSPNTIGPPFVTGPDGRFAFSVVDGRRYSVRARRPGIDAAAESLGGEAVFTVSGAETITVQLRPAVR